MKYYVCNYCRIALNKNKMPSRCFLNGLEIVPIPRELAGLDPLSCQLIQRAKVWRVNTAKSITRVLSMCFRNHAYQFFVEHARSFCRAYQFFVEHTSFFVEHSSFL